MTPRDKEQILDILIEAVETKEIEIFPINPNHGRIGTSISNNVIERLESYTNQLANQRIVEELEALGHWCSENIDPETEVPVGSPAEIIFGRVMTHMYNRIAELTKAQKGKHETD